MKHLMQIKVEKLAMGGSGIAFQDGKAVFIPHTAPGDVVDAVITTEKKDHAFAKVTHYHSRGEGVTEVPCDAFDKEPYCGGCDWLMVDYDTQTAWKDALVQELFQSSIAPENIAPIIPSPLPRHYRNKVYMPMGNEGYGIFAPWSHEIVTHTACMNHPPIFDQIAQRTWELCQKAKVEPYNEQTHTGTLRHIGLRSNKDHSEILLILVTRSGRLPFAGLIAKSLSSEFPQIQGIIQNINPERGNVILGEKEKILHGVDHIFDRMSDLSFRIHYRSFWQINTGTMENITAAMRSCLTPNARVLDAYCGIGAIGLCLANEVQSVCGVEEVPEAVQDAGQNAADNGINNAAFHCGRFEELLPSLLAKESFDVMILDPPRSGVDKSALEAILEAKIPQILYLSCAPMTLKRDLKLLSTAYDVTRLMSFDMFPNTWHIECLAVLSLKP